MIKCLFITVENVTETVISIADILATTDIIVNIIVIIGGILGFNYIRKLREKQVDSTFSYLMRLNVRLKYFYEVLDTYKEEIMDCFVPENCRREISANRIHLVANVIKHLSESAQETLEFLMNENNQMPAQEGWTDHLNLFIEFLIDCEQLNQTVYFKWSDENNLDAQKEKYYTDNLKNIEELIEMVKGRQTKLENKIFKVGKKNVITKLSRNR